MTLLHDRFSCRRWLAGALLLAAPLLGWAQADPPARVATISALEGGAAQLATDGRGFAPAALNWPVTSGTRIVADPGARVELHSGWSALRLTSGADASVTLLDDSTTQLALMNGTLSLRVRQLQPGERIEIDTPQLAVVANQAGEYRIDVDPRADTTRLTVHAGGATVYGESGQANQVGQGQQVQYAGRALAIAQTGTAYRDGFDQWVGARDALEDRSPSARYVPRDLPGYQQLDAYGQWSQDPTYGAVWYPSVTVADWAPYRYGRWTWVDPWGWTWVDDAPWGFAPSHYGRWAQIGPRWAWVPGSFGPRPVYSPALVAFVGGAGGRIALGGGLPGAAWFPLAPGEAWTPHYHASDRYRRGLNWADGPSRPRPPGDSYHFQRRPGAITVAPVDQFGRDDRGRRPHFGDASRLPAGALGDGVVAPPPRLGPPGAPPLNPLPMPRPDRHGMTDPRQTRIGADRGVLPAPGVMPPRFGGSDGPRPAPGMAAPPPPVMQPAPDFGSREGDRYPRYRGDRMERMDRMDRDGARPFPPPAPRPAAPDQPGTRPWQTQPQPQAPVMREPPRMQPLPQAPMAPPAAAPALPRPSFDHAPRPFDRPAMPQPDRRGGESRAPMREPQLNPVTGLSGR